MIPTLEWTPEGIRFLDQTCLPLKETYVLATTYQEVAEAILNMVVRGAPAIGVSAAMGLALGVKDSTAETVAALADSLHLDQRHARRHASDRRESLLGHRAHAPPLLLAGRPSRDDRQNHPGRDRRGSPRHV